MKNKIILIIIFLLSNILIYQNIFAQCGCTNCPQDMPDNSSNDFFINVSDDGSNTSDLNLTTNPLEQVCIDFVHTYLGDLTITLTSPGGQTITLVGPAGFFGGTTNSTWDICFVVTGNETGDPGATCNFGLDGPPSTTWDNSTFECHPANHTGSYLPNSGALTDFTGTSDGTWTLGVTDNQGFDAGVFNDFQLVFTDPTGLSCDSEPPPPSSCNIGADQGTDVEYCFGATPNTLGTDAGSDFTGFDAGPNATANAGVVYAEICGEYDPANNITTGDPTSNSEYTGFLVGTGYTYFTGTVDGEDGEGTDCDYLTLVPITHIDIDGLTGQFILDDPANICIGTPIRIDYRPEITVTGDYDCGTNAVTLTIAGGSPDDGVLGDNADGTATITGEYMLTGDVSGTTSSDEITFSNLANNTYNYTITDPDGCTQTASFVVDCVNNCSLSLTTEAVTCVANTDGNDDYTVIFDFSGGPVTDLMISPTPDAGSADPTVDATGTLTFTFTEPNNYTITLENDGGTANCNITVMGDAPSCDGDPPPPPTCMPPTVNSTIPGCTGGRGTGTITIDATSNTGGSLEYSIDGNAFQSSNMFNNLDNGSYTITVQDANASCNNTATVNINCIRCPTAIPTNNSDDVCVDGNSELADWQTAVTNANANVDGMTGPFYSDVPRTHPSFPSPIDNAIYDGNNCNSEASSYYAYYTCDDNGTFIPAGSYNLTIYPNISLQNNIVIDDGSCCPSLDIQCSQGLYQVTNSLDSRGTAPFCFNVTTNGTITFTISLRNPPTGLSANCLSQTITATYDCRVCPTSRFANGTLYFCDNDAALDLTIGGNTGVNVNTDPSNTFAGVEWYTQGMTPGSGMPYVVGNTSVTNNCDSETTILEAYLLCDLNGDGFTGGADDSYVPAGGITIIVYPDLAAQNNIVLNEGGCCPMLQLECPNDYRYTNSLQNTVGDPNCIGLQGEGNFNFVVQLNNAPAGLAANCRTITIPVMYRCCIAEAGTITSEPSCPQEDIIVQVMGQIPDGDYGTWLIIADDSGDIVETIDFGGTGSISISYDDWTTYAGYGMVYTFYSYSYQLAQLPVPDPSVATNMADIGSTTEGCFDLSGGVETYIPQEFGTADLNMSEGSQGSVTPFFYNTHAITFMGGVPPYDFEWEQTGYVRRSVHFYKDGYDHEIDDLDMPEAPGISNINPGGLIEIIYSDQATWKVTISDANGCSQSTLQMSNDPNSIGGGGQILDVYDHTIIGTSNANAADGTIEIAVEGGCPPYTYQWGGPVGFVATTEDITDIQYGWYFVSITDAGGSAVCPDDAQQTTMGWYWVPKGINNAGGGVIRGKTNESIGTYLQAYPNPLETHTNVVFTTHKATQLTVSLYSITGQKIKDVFFGTTTAQQLYTITLAADQLASGLYMLQLTTATGERQQQKLLITH